ncbi:HotDog domain containing protein [Elaphomyces granulatus]
MAFSEGIHDKKSRKRKDYVFHLEYRTRWADNDMYGHLNNSIYGILFDSIINTYLIHHCGLNPSYNNYSPFSTPIASTPPASAASSAAASISRLPPPAAATMMIGGSHNLSPTTTNQVGIVVSSYCDYFASVSFPDMLDLGLRVTRLGFSSVTYEVGVFKRGEENVKAVGGFTHVFVGKDGTRLNTTTTTTNNNKKTDAGSGMEEGLRAGLERLMMKRSDDNGESSKL